MSLLKLAPDSERLRRIARAYAAGEVAESEYRRIRSEVIDRFAPGTNVGDDTEQRWVPSGEHERAPREGLDIESRAPEVVRVAAAPDQLLRNPDEPRQKMPRLVWVAAALLVAGVIVIVLMA
jgi:hypothetical protein